MKRQYRTLLTEFKHEASALVLDQGYTVTEVCCSLDVGEAALRRWVDQLLEECRDIAHKIQSMPTGLQRIKTLEAQVCRLEQEKRILKKATALFNVGRLESYQLIDQLSEHEPTNTVCRVFGIKRSSYYDYRLRKIE